MTDDKKSSNTMTDFFLGSIYDTVHYSKVHCLTVQYSKVYTVYHCFRQEFRPTVNISSVLQYTQFVLYTHNKLV